MWRESRLAVVTVVVGLLFWVAGFDLAFAQDAVTGKGEVTVQETGEALEPQSEQTTGASGEKAKQPDDQEMHQKTRIKALQTALNNHGCNAGAADGIWGKRSLRALERFARHAGLVMKSAPSPDVLAAVEAEPEPVCPPSCGPQYKMKGGKCVARGCPVGQSPDRQGRCIDTLRICSADCRRKSCGPQIEGWDCKENGISCLVNNCKLSNQAADWRFHNIWVPILNR